jgi:exosortase/archaeosortase family protein
MITRKLSRAQFPIKVKLAVWLAVSLAFSIPFFGAFRQYIFELLTQPEATIQQYGSYHWGVLAFCLAWAGLNRKEIGERLPRNLPSWPYISLGLALVALGALLPLHHEFTTLAFLLAWLGFFFCFFGRAALVPALLFAMYAFGLTFSSWAEVIGGPTLTSGTAVVASVITQWVSGQPVTGNGQMLNFVSHSGSNLAVIVNASCSGLSTVGLFIPLYALMYLDRRLPWKRAVGLFIIGLAGTWLFNALRVAVILLTGYFWGQSGLETAHILISYFIFPAWYVVFLLVYIWQARKYGRAWLWQQRWSRVGKNPPGTAPASATPDAKG